MSILNKNPKTKMSDFDEEGVNVSRKARAYEETLVQMSEPRSKKGYRAGKWTVRIFILVIVLLTLSNFFMSRNNRALNDQLQANISDTYNPAFKVRYADLGRQVIHSWYSNLPAPVQVASDVTWPNSTLTVDPETGLPVDASTVEEPPVKVENISFIEGVQLPLTSPDMPNAYQEQLSYTCTLNGVNYTCFVTLAIPDIANYTTPPVLISPPALGPVPPENQELQSITIKPNGNGWNGIDLSQNAVSQIDAWAQAWTIGDGNALKRLTGDTREDALYYGMPPGWTFQTGTLTVVWASENKNLEKTVAQVQWAMVPPGGDAAQVQKQEMNILISNADSGLPNVSAWGPNGSYSVLTPFMNAVLSENIVVPSAAPTSDVVGSPTPTPSATPSGSPSPTASTSPTPTTTEASPSASPTETAASEPPAKSKKNEERN